MTEAELGILMGVLGAALLVAGFVVLWVRRRFDARARVTEGEVVELSDDSGEFPTVTFTAETPEGPRPVRFRSHLTEGSYHVGQRLPVHYDPQRPEKASISAGRLATTLGLSLLAGGVLTLASAGILVTVVAPTTGAARTEVERFFDALRHDDPEALDAVEDEGLAKLLVESESHESQRSSIGLDEACFELRLRPRGGTIYLRAAKDRDDWRVVQAAKNLPCASDLE